jgi:iron complex transport system substrate-binding protein
MHPSGQSSSAWWVRTGTLAILACTALSNASVAASITLRDDRGRDVVLPGSPLRIVSLLPSLTESVCALGGCGRLVGVDRHSNWPDAVRALPKLGTLQEASIERVVALRPDVVLADRSERSVARFESLGLAVLVFDTTGHDDVRRTLGVLASMLGDARLAAPVWAAIERDLDAATARVPAAMRGQRVYFEVDTAPYAAGEASFIGQTLRRMGLANAVPLALGPFPKLNPEFVARLQPDVIMGAVASVEAMPRRPGWSAIDALRRGRSCGYTPAVYDLLVRPGPRLGEAAQRLADCVVGLPR